MATIKNASFLFSTMVIILIITALPSCGGSASVDKDSVKDALQKTKEAAQATKEAVQETSNDVKYLSDAALDSASEAVNDAGEAIKSGAEKSIDKVKDTADKVVDSAQKAADKTKEAANNTKETADKAIKEVKAAATTQPTTSNPSAPSKSTSATQPSTKTSPVNTSATTTSTKPTKPTVKETAQTKPSKPAPIGPNHEAFDQLLREHVSADGSVNYAGLKADMPKFDAYLNNLSQNPVRSNWPRNKQLAYWINAYNAFTIKLILNNYPVNKITDLEGGKPWDKKWIKLGDNTYSLNNIENDIIRPQFKEPRIHFAVNCAAKSCPPLLNRAWTAVNLEKYFESQTKKFVNNSSFNQISAKEASLSKIFEWYGEDFGDLRSFLNKYSTTTINSKSNLNYMDYDWNLNGK